MPEPPKPEPPVEEKQATAPQQARAPQVSVARWQTRLAAHIERFKRYPAEARSRGEQGIAKVAFKIDHEGRVLSSRIVQSSGSTALDQETLAMLARAQPMPPPPDQISDAELNFVVPVRFNFR
jgi:protein TonB